MLRFRNPAWPSLTGHHAHLAEVCGSARRYPADVSVFAALDPAAEDPWRDLAELVGPGGMAGFADVLVPDPSTGFELAFQAGGFQFVLDRDPKVDEFREFIELGPSDRQEMFDLVKLTEPGPFELRTPELGDYIGVRRGGRLIAMAGERLHPDGATEISAVATHPDARRQGLAAALTGVLARRIRARGEIPFLHTIAENESAQRVYEALGFERVGSIDFLALRAVA